MPTADTATDKVSVDLLIRSKHRKRAVELDPSQLSVTDDGLSVQLSSFRRVDIASGQQHLAAFVFDRLNQGEARDTRRAAEKILGAIPDQGYSVSVLQVNGRLHLLQGYTQDFHAVDAAVIAATPNSPATPTANLTAAENKLIDSVHSDALTFSSSDRTKAKILLSALEESQRILENRHSYPSLAALEALVQSDRPVEGRKFIFYFCSGIAANSDAREVLRSIVSLANRIGVTLYVVDASPHIASMSSPMQASQASSILGNTSTGGGVTAFGATASANTGAAAMNNALVHDVANFEFGAVDVDQSPLFTLSSGTGGMYINASDISKRQLQEMHDEFSTWYQASWVPPNENYDGQFRPIEIRSHRKDLVIRSRSGYFAVPPSSSSEIEPFEAPLLKILESTTSPSDVVLHAGIMHLGMLADGNSAELVVQVPISQLETHEDANTHICSAQAAILAVIKDSKGNVLQRFAENFPLHSAPKMLRGESSQMITLQRSFSADPGVYTLDAVVVDQLANKAGVQRITFTIEAPPQGLALSDIALVHNIEPVEETGDTFEPMRYDDGRVVPGLVADFSGSTSSLPLFFLLHPIAGSQAPLLLRMQISRDNKLLSDRPMDLHDVSGTGAVVPYLATIGSHIIPPGNYQVRVLLTQDGHIASNSVSFRVERNVAVLSSAGASFNVASTNSADADSGLVSKLSTNDADFIITRAMKPIPPPSDTEVQSMIEDARERALSWSDSLRNFLCLEVTKHFVDASGRAEWKQKGILVERMQYVDHEQTRTTVSLNGDPSTIGPDQLEFFHSNGEFGAIFHIIFDPEAKAVFTWKQSSWLDGQPVQVISFTVARGHSSFNLSDRDNHIGAVGFHGLLYLDSATQSVRRVSIVADDIPPSLLIRASSISVDYSWISMQNHDFLLPIRGAVRMQEAKRHAVLNEFVFRNYHRFGSRVQILEADRSSSLQ